MPIDPKDVTRLLADAGSGDPRAADRLLPIVYDELRALASSFLAAERSDHTLQATALVHEVYLKLAGQDRADPQSRTQFFCVAAQAIRHILTDHARTRNRQKRGGKHKPVPLEDSAVLALDNDQNLEALDDALTKLAMFDPEGARVVELRFFGGLTMEEIAAALQLGKRTVEERWRNVRRWLEREMSTS